MAKVGSFIKGLRGEHASLDGVLSGKVVDKKYRLVDLKRANVSYDSASQTVTIHRNDSSNSVHVPVRRAFHDYMEKHGDTVSFMTRNGTPWLTEEEKNNPEKVADYYLALKAGPKQDLAIINWRKTDGSTRDTGHSAVSVGELSLTEAEPEGKASEGKSRRIEEYKQHAGGSFYPSQSLWFDRKNHTETMKEATGRDTGEDPSSHAQGVLIRNSLKPSAAAGVAGAAAILATRGNKKGGKIRTALRAATVLGVAYSAGHVSGQLQSSAGSIKIKDEDVGHGVLATLITPSQHDLLEHSLVGLSKTYHGKYNVMRSNCADFAEDMMGVIGLNVNELVQAAMETAPQEGKKRRGVGERVVPHHIRPDRNQWAVRQLEAGQEGVIDVDGQDICMRQMEISGQSTLLIEAAEGEKFNGKPIDVLSKILSKGVSIDVPNNDMRHARFTYQPEVKITQTPAKDSQISR